MTSRELQIAFQQIYESHADYAQTPIFTRDIFYYLNEAQRNMFDIRWAQFEQSQRLTDELRPFVVEEEVISTSYNNPGYTPNHPIDVASLPEGYRYLLSHQSDVLVANNGGTFVWEVSNNKRIPQDASPGPEFTDYTRKTVNNRFAQHDDVRQMLDDPFNKTKATRPLITLSESGINIYTDSNFIVDNVIINYIKDPIDIEESGTTSLFPDYLHPDLVELAVSLYFNLQLEPNNSNT